MNTLNFDSTKLFPVPEFTSTRYIHIYTFAEPDTKIKLRRYLVICNLFVKLYYMRCCPGIMAPSIVFYVKLIKSRNCTIYEKQRTKKKCAFIWSIVQIRTKCLVQIRKLCCMPMGVFVAVNLGSYRYSNPRSGKIKGWNETHITLRH